MNVSHMKNIIVLKDLPSNVVDEAIVILKSGAKVKVKSDSSEAHLIKGNTQKSKECFSDSAIKEAEFLISDYLKSIEKPAQNSNASIRKMRLECKKLKMYTALFGFIAIVCAIFCILG